ncbi:MAG: PrpR N-terminal domain-containing protein [Selenomonadales bacterium]|jgi:transcriptional regulator with PAS, ATPase and Fis domain|nr:PrpR N-terminal domain-containing protein [Selenomonadales bacterium]
MRKLRILVVAPYAGLKDMFMSIGENRDDLEITAYQADLEAGADLVRQLDESEYDIIISRGGTAKLIRDTAQLPVIEIALSHYDLMGVMKLAESHIGKCAIVGFPNICKMAKVLRDILQSKVEIVEIERTNDVYGAIQTLAEKGYTMIFGDTISFTEAQRQGLTAVLITSSRESALTAVEEAVSFYRNLEKIRGQNQMLHQATRLGGGGVIIFAERDPIFSNIKKDKELFLRITREMNPTVLRNSRHTLVQKVDNRNVKVSGHLVQIDGTTYCIYLIEQVDRGENHVIPGVYAIVKQDLHGSYFSLNSSYDSKLLQDIDRCRNSRLPVIVVGETGTGKERVANMLISGRGKSYCIDFDELDTKGLAHLLGSTDSCLLLKERTVCFKNIHSLTEERLQRLLAFVESSQLHLRNRLIVTLTTRLSDLHHKYAYRAFNSRMPSLTIKLLPLRERAEDIPGLLGAFLNEINVVHGLNILGCEPEGIAMLKQFPWEHNLGQLKRVLSTLASITKGSYISAHDVKWALDNEGWKQILPATGQVSVNTKQPIEKITHDILAAVLREEGMNQTRAARRLGISRTTLWRMLQRGSG